MLTPVSILCLLGFPPLIVELPAQARAAGLLAFDDRVYQQTSTTLGTLTMGFNGWVELRLRGPTAHIRYLTLSHNGTDLSYENPTVMAEEQFTVQADGQIELQEQIICDVMTVVDHVAADSTPYQLAVE
jgi:hypothetical protein